MKTPRDGRFLLTNVKGSQIWEGQVFFPFTKGWKGIDLRGENARKGGNFVGAASRLEPM